MGKSGVVILLSRPADVYGMFFIERASSRRVGWETMNNLKVLVGKNRGC